MKSSNTVELKLTLPDTDHRSTGAALGIDPLDAQIRQIYFFDTPDLALNRAGVVARARRIQGRPHDSVVKLRPIVPDELPPGLRKLPNMGVEVDAMPGGYVCSASLKGQVGPTIVREVASGKAPIRKAFSKEQRTFFAAHAPEGIELDDLAILGPVLVLKLKVSPKGFGRKLATEMWLYPDGSRIVELSTRCTPSEAFQVGMEMRSFLAKCGVDLSGEQQTKTKIALEFFAGHLG